MSNLTPVVQKVDNAIHQINHYPLDSAIGSLFPRLCTYQCKSRGGGGGGGVRARGGDLMPETIPLLGF